MFKFQGNNGEAEPVVEEHVNVVYTKSARPFPGISIIGNSNEHYRGKVNLNLRSIYCILVMTSKINNYSLRLKLKFVFFSMFKLFVVDVACRSVQMVIFT